MLKWRGVLGRAGPGPGFIFSVRVIRAGSENMIPDPFRSGSQNFSGPGNPVRVGSYVTRPFSGLGFIFCRSGLGFPAIFFAYNYSFSSYLSLGSMLDRLDLKKYSMQIALVNVSNEALGPEL